jgi:DNA-binding response OmpR family regulator
MKILVVEDDDAMAEALSLTLEDELYEVDVAVDGASADERATVNEYDLVVLDWTIPPPSGVELVRQWRERGLEFPILMLTARDAHQDRVAGLDAGADDYLTKPFHYPELLARVRSLLRRRSKALAPLAAGDLELDRSAREVRLDGEPIDLSPKEFGVLEYLLTHAGRAVSREAVIEHVWETDHAAESNVFDVILSRVRRKIDGERQGKLLETVKGFGYRLRTERR